MSSYTGTSLESSLSSISLSSLSFGDDNLTFPGDNWTIIKTKGADIHVLREISFKEITEHGLANLDGNMINNRIHALRKKLQTVHVLALIPRSFLSFSLLLGGMRLQHIFYCAQRNEYENYIIDIMWNTFGFIYESKNRMF